MEEKTYLVVQSGYEGCSISKQFGKKENADKWAELCNECLDPDDSERYYVLEKVNEDDLDFTNLLYEIHYYKEEWSLNPNLKGKWSWNVELVTERLDHFKDEGGEDFIQRQINYGKNLVFYLDKPRTEKEYFSISLYASSKSEAIEKAMSIYEKVIDKSEWCDGETRSYKNNGELYNEDENI